MPKRTDIKKIMIIGAGPIIISQACEFDYSGTQACKALKEEGYEVVLINSNPATIMTDPELADYTYVEPINAKTIERILERERPDAILPTLGGQTALNAAVEIAHMGLLEKYNVEMIGANAAAIEKAEDRQLFREAMQNIGLRIPRSGIARNMDDVKEIAKEIGFPIIVRPSFTLGGTGGGVAYNPEELETIAKAGLDASSITQIMLEESVLGWKEIELEVVRDKNDDVVIICSIENFDPMGVHTGDSITVAPVQTLTDREYQELRSAGIAIIREIGVETGGSNIQFAINPKNGELVVIEMNPRVSRSSALASKATGFPIAKVATKLAVGYSLAEIENDITGETLASFEPAIDYCVIKIPRFAFEKFPQTEDVLTTAMRSVGETMAIGRTFREALQKGLRGLEIGRFGFGGDGKSSGEVGCTGNKLRQKLITPNSMRIFYIREALLQGYTVEDLYELTAIDPWFLNQLVDILNLEKEIKAAGQNIDKDLMLKAKQYGFADVQLGFLLNKTPDEIRAWRKALGVTANYKLVDTCAAEFLARTPYYYSSYEEEDEVRISDKKKVMILGGGPNRIGQGIEFDYCCVHAAFALEEEGVESIMVNSNPETVSTDYDTSDKLYFEPLTQEDVLNIVDKEKPDGLIVQFGGQTPLNLALGLKRAGCNIIGTQPESIDMAEDRKQFQAMLQKLNLRQPANGTANTVEEATEVANQIGYPVVVRPSYVLGGRAMKIVYDDEDMQLFAADAIKASLGHPVLIDKFVEDATEIDVDAICDGEDTVIGGIMEHIEEAGIHSGDSACVLPPVNLSRNILDQIVDATKAMARELNVKGLMNVQYAVTDNEELYVLEVNPRASRTVPFVSKATGMPLAKLATKVMLGKTLKELNVRESIIPHYRAVKEAVLPFDRFPGVDTLLGPEMKSTGEVMGIGEDFGVAFAKAQAGAKQSIPSAGRVFVSIRDHDKNLYLLELVNNFKKAGFEVLTTKGTCKFLCDHGIETLEVKKVSDGRPNIVDSIVNGEVQLIVNTAVGEVTKSDGYEIRRAALKYKVPYTTTLAGGLAISESLKILDNKALDVKTLQEYHLDIAAKKI